MIRTSFSITHEDERVRDRVLEEVGEAGRQQEEQADREQQREDDRARPGAAADLLLLALSSGGICALAEMPSALKPIFSDSPSATTPRMIGSRSSGGACPRDERLGDDLDLALGAAPRAELAGLELLRRGLAHRHRPGGDAAHHHALEHRLAADRRVRAARSSRPSAFDLAAAAQSPRSRC